MAFSMEKGNLYQSDNIKGAENLYKEKRDRVLDNIIYEGMATQNSETREDYRTRLRDKIKEGFIDREYLSKYGWSQDRVLITSDIVDFLFPQIKPIVKEKKEDVGPMIKQIKEVILPTEDSNGLETGSKTGMKEKRLIPRFELLVNFLKENKIPDDNYFCYRGKNVDEMIRGESYVMFVIPDLKKMALLCDEEGNATYIIHNAPTKDEFEKLKRDEYIEENERLPRFYYQMSKNDLQILMKELGIVSSIKWDEKKWLEAIEDELTKEVNFDFTIKDIKKFLEGKNNIIEQAPSGWMTNYKLAAQLGAGYYVVKQIANKHLETNKDWSKLFLDSSRRVRYHYSPELVEIITKELTKYEPAPSGWMTNGALAKLLKRSNELIEITASKQLKTNKDWFKTFLDGTGKACYHYSPELIDIITKELTKYEPAPLGWMTNNGLASQLGAGRKIVKKIADKYIETNKDWFKQFKDVAGKVSRHYSPELIAKIKQDLSL